jgi:hypothetical protein
VGSFSGHASKRYSARPKMQERISWSPCWGDQTLRYPSQKSTPRPVLMDLKLQPAELVFFVARTSGAGISAVLAGRKALVGTRFGWDYVLRKILSRQDGPAVLQRLEFEEREESWLGTGGAHASGEINGEIGNSYGRCRELRRISPNCSHRCPLHAQRLRYFQSDRWLSLMTCGSNRPRAGLSGTAVSSRLADSLM